MCILAEKEIEMSNTENVKLKLKEQEEGIEYGCHIGIECGFPVLLDCVIDYGSIEDCAVAIEYKCREECEYWKRIDD